LVSAITKTKNKMTDTNPSGAPSGPAADTQASAASAETPAGSFGSTRGSGLLRGKRPSGATAPTASPAKSDYKPTAVEVITLQREYKNPFASQEPESAPVAEPAEPEEQPAPAPAAEAPQPEAPAAPAEPAPIEPEAEKREIQILPPAEAVRPSVSWESPSASRTGQEPGERPIFRADRREDMAENARPEGAERRYERRESRHDPYRGQPRDPRDEPQYEQRPRREQTEAAPPAPKGFIAWLKGLFGGAKPAETPASREFGAERFGDGQRHRRRHRGGRGHGVGPQGMRNDRSPQGGERFPQGGENDGRAGERYGGNRRRRHRGGQGRDGGGPRSEGHQGGGAI
jgi:translation initiation factor IF-2